MIPKKIHYCWLSNDPYPYKIKKCINTWGKRLPDYEIKLWNIESFDIDSIPFVKEACSLKKWAFAADYIRLYALYTEGGIYLDSDVVVNKKFDTFLKNDFFSALEYQPDNIKRHNTLALINDDGTPKSDTIIKQGIGLQAAIMGSKRGHPFIKDCLDFYANRHFILEDDNLYNKALAPNIYAQIAENYGFLYINKEQKLKENMLILPSDYLAGNLKEQTDRTHAIHLCAGSWRHQGYERILHLLRKTSLFRALRKNTTLRGLVKKNKKHSLKASPAFLQKEE